MTHRAIVPFILATLVACAHGALPVRTTLESADELDKGELNNVSLSSEGNLRLAPRLRVLPAPKGDEKGFDDVFVWSLLAAPDGTLWAGTGNGGAVLTGDATRGMSLVARTGELVVTALARDAKGVVYAATIPNGKVFRVSGNKLELFAQVPSPYVWALAAHPDGRLLAATGPEGVLYAIAPDKTVTPFWKSQEKNLTALALGADGAIFAGTEPSGLVVKLTPEGKPSVLFDASQSEIRALAVDKRGRVYAAATSAQRGPIAPGGPGGGPGGPPAGPPGEPGKRAHGRSESAPPAPAALEPPPAPRPPPDHPAKPEEPSAGSSRSASATRFGRKGVDANQVVYRIEPDGVATSVLSAAQTVLLSLALDEKDRVWVGTGNQGVLFRVEDRNVVKLVRTDASHVMALAPLAGGGVAFGTGGPARVVVAGPEPAAEGHWLSEARDFGAPTRFGTIGFRQQPTAAGKVRVSTRSGNSAKPDETWSAWSEPSARGTGSAVASPPARYLQVKVELATSDTASSPEVAAVWVVSQQANAAPEIDKLVVGMPNVDPTGELRDVEQREAARQKEKKKREPAWLRHLKWEASDANDDKLTFRLALRAEGESQWRDLTSRDLTTNTLEWDAQDLPDGFYRVRVTASDAASNPEESALTAEQISDPFLVDATPPRVDLQAVVVGEGTVEISGAVQDGPGNVVNVEVAVDEADYRVVAVSDGLADGPREMYRTKLTGLAPGEHTIAVRAYDELGNAGSVRKAVLVPGR